MSGQTRAGTRDLTPSIAPPSRAHPPASSRPPRPETCGVRAAGKKRAAPAGDWLACLSTSPVCISLFAAYNPVYRLTGCAARRSPTRIVSPSTDTAADLAADASTSAYARAFAPGHGTRRSHIVKTRPRFDSGRRTLARAAGVGPAGSGPRLARLPHAGRRRPIRPQPPRATDSRDLRLERQRARRRRATRFRRDLETTNATVRGSILYSRRTMLDCCMPVRR